jgi:hypothetical protein
MFIVTGFLTVIAQIERNALTIFSNICRQKDNVIEKRIGLLRQLTVKDMDSNSWFIVIKKMLYKYELLHPITLMNNPPRKLEWKKSVDIAFNKYWSNLLIAKCKSYPSLEFVCTDKFQQ